MSLYSHSLSKLRTCGWVRAVSAGAALAVLLSGCSGALSASDSVVPASGGDWNPMSVAGLGVNGAGGALAPVYPGSVVTDTQGLAVSTGPMLMLPSVTPDSSGLQFEVLPLGGGPSVFSGNSQQASNWVQLPPGTLAQGQAYTWQAQNADGGKVSGPYMMTVDIERAGKQPVQSFGPISVDVATGSASMSVGLRGVGSASGNLGVNLLFRTDQDTDPGLPKGWALQGANQSWSHIQVPAGQSPAQAPVSLVSVNGMTSAYQPNSDGVSFTPVVVPGRVLPTGSLPTLVLNPDGTLTATSTGGITATFAAPDNTGRATLTGTYNGTTAAPIYGMDSGGRLTLVQDSVTASLPDGERMEIDLAYQGDESCPDIPGANQNFDPVPDGMLCGITYLDGSSTIFLYTHTSNNQPLLARIVDYPETNDYKPAVTDIGYDNTGRITSVRQPQAANLTAATSETNTWPASKPGDATTQIFYCPDSRELNCPAGAVQSVIKPLAAQGEPPAIYAMSYDQPAASPSQPTGQTGTTKVNLASTPGANPAPPAPPAGHQISYTYSANSLLQTSVTDSEGKTSSTTWNESTDQKQFSQDHNNLTTLYTYDSNNNLSSWAGPYAATFDQHGNPSTPPSFAPSESYTYDQATSSNTPSSPNDMTGFALTYWNNASLTGAPSGYGQGPTVDGSLPGTTAFAWQQNPNGADQNGQPWAARMTGTLDYNVLANVSKSGPKAARLETTVPSQFTFSINTNSSNGQGPKLWINNQPCTGGTCTVSTSSATSAQFRIDLPVEHPMSNGGSGINFTFQSGSASNNMAPLPITAVKPGYGLTSVVTKNDEVGGAKTATHFTGFDKPWTAQPTDAFMVDPAVASISGTSTYEDFDPANQNFGRRVSSAQPAGNQTRYAYYGADEAAGNPCGGGSQPQFGLPSTLTRSQADGQSDPGGTQTYQTFYDNMGRVTASQATGGDGAALDPTCTTYNDAGQVQQVSAPARGDDVPASTMQVVRLVNGDPLTTATVVNVEGSNPLLPSGQIVAQTTADLLGRPVTTTDMWGTTQKYTYDPYTGNVTNVVTTTKSGFSTTSAMTYTNTGDLNTVTVDNKLVATSTESSAPGQPGTVLYGNGVKLDVYPSAIGGFSSQLWTTSDNSNLTYNTAVSPAQRILNEAFGFDVTNTSQPNAAYGYTYDALGRLTNAALTTSLPVTQKNWSYNFGPSSSGGNAQAWKNSNRSSQTVTNADGTTTTTNYTYNDYDQLTGTTDPAIGNAITYSNLGEITQLGGLTIDYNATSQVHQITDSATNQVIDYTRVGGAIAAKTVTWGETSTTSKYTAGGLILDADGNQQWQVISLPGGATLQRDLTAGTSEYQHNTIRGQRMWSSDDNGHDTGDHRLYSPFGEDITAGNSNTASKHSGSGTSSRPGSAAVASPSTTSTASPAPVSPSTTSAMPAPTATTSVPATPSPQPSGSPSNELAITDDSLYAPNLDWQAGAGIETETLGTGTTSISVMAMGARLYIPSLGRFTSPDPTNQGSVNSYDYANQDPINQSDPSGNMPNWLRELLGIVVEVAVTFASILIPEGLTAMGFTAEAVAGMTTVKTIAVAAVNVVGAQLNQVLAGQGSVPFWNNPVNDIGLALNIGMSYTGFRAEANAGNAAAAVTATEEVSAVKAEANEMVKEPSVPEPVTTGPASSIGSAKGTQPPSTSEHDSRAASGTSSPPGSTSTPQSIEALTELYESLFTVPDLPGHPGGSSLSEMPSWWEALPQQ